MSMMEIISLRGREVKNGVLSLGYINGWSDNTNRLYRELKEFWVHKTYQHSGPASNQVFSVILKDGDLEIEMQWKLDSGD